MQSNDAGNVVDKEVEVEWRRLRSQMEGGYGTCNAPVPVVRMPVFFKVMRNVFHTADLSHCTPHSGNAAMQSLREACCHEDDEIMSESSYYSQ